MDKVTIDAATEVVPSNYHLLNLDRIVNVAVPPAGLLKCFHVSIVTSLSVQKSNLYSQQPQEYRP
jgi:hypothetical protein